MQERLQHFVAYVCASKKHVSHLLLGFGTLLLITLLQPHWLAGQHASNGKLGQQSGPFPARDAKLSKSPCPFLFHSQNYFCGLVRVGKWHAVRAPLQNNAAKSIPNGAPRFLMWKNTYDLVSHLKFRELV